VAGGKPRITGHRITVMDIAVWHEWLGHSAAEISTEYELSLADVYAALAYYHGHRAESDAQMRESEAFVEALRQQIPSKVPGKLRGRQEWAVHRREYPKGRW
jgi:uncharacterized protein (DUF433 family)